MQVFIIKAKYKAIRNNLVVKYLNNLYVILDLNLIAVNVQKKKRGKIQKRLHQQHQRQNQSKDNQTN